MNATVDPLPIAPAVFLGMQDCDGLRPDFALYNLTADLPGHPRGSTVTEMTLVAAGYAVPTRAGSRSQETGVS